MKRISYLINDRLGFEKHMEEEQLKQIKGFSAYYTLEENEKGILYCLEDLNGNKLNINSLNGYEKMYMDECFDCFCKDKEISENYKDFIKILDNPREIKKPIIADINYFYIMQKKIILKIPL